MPCLGRTSVLLIGLGLGCSRAPTPTPAAGASAEAKAATPPPSTSTAAPVAAVEREEAVVGFSGCDSGARTEHSYASHALVRREAAGWRRLTYTPRGLGKCTKIATKAGRDGLVCDLWAGNMGWYRHEFSIFAFDDAPMPSERKQTFLEFGTDSPPLGSKPRVVTVKQFAVTPAAVELDLQSELGSDVRSIQLRYTFDGERFTLVPESKGALTLLLAREAKH